MDDKRNRLLDSAIFLAAVTAFLYCASSAHTGGFYEYLELDADVLSRDLQQILYDGFVVSFVPVFAVLACYFFLRLFYGYAVLPGINDHLRQNWRRKRSFIKRKHDILGTRKDSSIERREKRHVVSVALLILVFLAFLVALVYFEGKGRAQATQLIDRIENRSWTAKDLMSVVVDGQVLRLLSLGCGARNCAGVDPTTRIVWYFPQNGHSYNLPLQQPKQKESSKSTSE